MILFKGDTREIRISIETTGGTLVDPVTLAEVKCWIYNYNTGDITGKWSMAGESGFESMSVTSDDKLLCALSGSQTQNGTVGQQIIQVSYEFSDIHASGSTHRISQKGILGYLRDAKY